MNNQPLRPELADLDRVALGPPMAGSTRHWVLLDGHPMGVFDMSSGNWWPLTKNSDGSVRLATAPSRPGQALTPYPLGKAKPN